jgi:hypothetical protein
MRFAPPRAYESNCRQSQAAPLTRPGSTMLIERERDPGAVQEPCGHNPVPALPGDARYEGDGAAAPGCRSQAHRGCHNGCWRRAPVSGRRSPREPTSTSSWPSGSNGPTPGAAPRARRPIQRFKDDRGAMMPLAPALPGTWARDSAATTMCASECDHIRAPQGRRLNRACCHTEGGPRHRAGEIVTRHAYS